MKERHKIVLILTIIITSLIFIIIFGQVATSETPPMNWTLNYSYNGTENGYNQNPCSGYDNFTTGNYTNNYEWEFDYGYRANCTIILSTNRTSTNNTNYSLTMKIGQNVGYLFTQPTYNIPQNCTAYGDTIQLNMSFSGYWGGTWYQRKTLLCNNATDTKWYTIYDDTDWGPATYFYSHYKWLYIKSNTYQYNFTNNLKPTCTVTTGAYDNTNQIYTTSEDFNNTLQCILPGYETLNENYDVIQFGDHTFTMTGAKLWINFTDYDGNKQSATGYYTDDTNSNITMFNSTSINITLANYQGSRIYINFGKNNTLNFTQSIEYNSTDYSIHKIAILENGDIDHWIQIRDQNGREIKDALVEISQAKTSNIPWEQKIFRVIGRRFTPDNGKINVILDKDYPMTLVVSKDGYKTSINQTIQVSRLTTSQTEPYVIYLEREDDKVGAGVVIQGQNRYNASSSFYLIAYAPTLKSFNWNSSQFPTLQTSTLNANYKSILYIEKGLIFNSNSTSDLILYFYDGNTLISTYTIKYRVMETRIDEPTGISTSWKTFFIWIGLILFISILGLIFGNVIENLGTGHAGEVMFMMGFITIGFLGIIGYQWFITIGGLYFALKGMRKLFGE